jgi:hypothetical protein
VTTRDAGSGKIDALAGKKILITGGGNRTALDRRNPAALSGRLLPLKHDSAITS